MARLFNDDAMGLASEQMMTRAAAELARVTQAMVAADEANIAELDDDQPVPANASSEAL